jgi:hypothetical protein
MLPAVWKHVVLNTLSAAYSFYTHRLSLYSFTCSPTWFYPQCYCLLYEMSPRLVPHSVPHLIYKIHVWNAWQLWQCSPGCIPTQFCYLKATAGQNGQTSEQVQLHLWSQWPRGLRRGSAAARLLRSWVRVPLGPWVSALVNFFCQVEICASGWSFVQRSSTECNILNCNLNFKCNFNILYLNNILNYT